jgi:hypothetical protein
MCKLKLTGLIGLTGSFLVGIGEFLLHYNFLGYEGANYVYLAPIKEWRIITGHFLSVLFVPLYIIGYWHFYLAIKPGSPKSALAILIAGIYAFVIGGMWIASRGMLAFMAKSLADGNAILSLLEKYNLLMETLVQILRLIVILISILFVVAILKKETLYPMWMAWFNPALVLSVVFFLFYFFPSIGNVIAPTALNVTHIAVFAASLLALKDKQDYYEMV